jgi:hypothetical protein
MDAKPAVFQAQPLKVTVKALPASDGKFPFSGLVGSFQIQAELDNADLKVGDSATLSLTIKGSGNIMDAQAPAVRVPESFKIYEDTPEEEIQVGRNGFSGQKVFRLALVPITEGRYTLPPVELKYFDAASARYETIQTQPLELSVAPSLTQEPLASYNAFTLNQPTLKQKVEFSGRDILPLKEEVEALENRSTLLFWQLAALLIIPVFLFTAAMSAIHLRRKKTDPASLMADRAQSALREALRSSASETSSQTFVACLYRSLKAAVFARAGREGESLTTIEAEKFLIDRGLPDPIAAEAARLLERLEAAGYGGLDLTPAKRAELLSETKAITKKLL